MAYRALCAAMRGRRRWQQDKRAEAHALSAPIDGWCTEGCDTADLQEAKILLEEPRRAGRVACSPEA
jgi:hypothetical protein